MTEPVKKKRGRPLLPRDEFGNIIRPKWEPPKDGKPNAEYVGHDESLDNSIKRSARAAALASKKKTDIYSLATDLSFAGPGRGRGFTRGGARGRGRGRGYIGISHSPDSLAHHRAVFGLRDGHPSAPGQLHFDGNAAVAAAVAVAAAGGFRQGKSKQQMSNSLNFFSSALDRASAFLPGGMSKAGVANGTSMLSMTPKVPSYPFDATDLNQSGLEKNVAQALAHKDSKRIQWYPAPPIDIVPKSPRPSHSLKYLLYRLSKSRNADFDPSPEPAALLKRRAEASHRNAGKSPKKGAETLEALLCKASEELFHSIIASGEANSKN